MGLLTKIEDKLSGHKNDTTTTDSKHSTNTSGLNSSSSNYNNTTGHHSTGLTGNSGLSSGTTGAATSTGAGSSVRHPIQSAENQYGSSNATSSYPTGSSGPTGIGSGSSGHTGIGSHSAGHSGPVPGSIRQEPAGYSGAGGNQSGYGTETHPSLREQERLGGSGAGYSGPASNTIGPHSSNAANVMDPRVQPNPQLQGSHSTAGTHFDNDRSNQHHYGRDGALAAGGAGAAYEAEKHHGHHGSHGSHHATPQQPYDPYSSAGQRTAASRVSEDNEYGRSGHHTGGVGRDREPSDLLPGHQAQNPSAIPTAGGAPVGSHGYNSSHDGYDQGKKEAYRQSAMGGGMGGGSSTTAGPHNSSLMNKLDPRVDSDRSKEQNHQYGRDAALAGGAGTAAYEADKHHHDHNRDHSGSHGIGSSDTSSHGLGGSNTGSHGIGGSSNTGNSSGGLAPERKLGGAYEAGYRDAMEHMKAEMGQR